MPPGLTRSRILRSLRSVVKVCREDAPVLWRRGTRLMRAFLSQDDRGIHNDQLPSLSSGRAFLAVNKAPLTLALKILSKCPFRDCASGADSSRAGHCEENVDVALVPLYGAYKRSDRRD